MAEPSDPSQQVSRQGRVFCEVDNGLECNVEGLNRDFMAERVERSGERSHWLWNTALDVEAKFSPISRLKTQYSDPGSTLAEVLTILSPKLSTVGIVMPSALSG
jgi:hypothetical protein